MISRQLASSLLRLAQGFPIVAVTGPRQSGKTTLVRSLFADKPYVSLENPAELDFAREDPQGFLARFQQGAIFDEAQRWPGLFSWLQGMVDADRRPGRFVLTGSQQFGLMSGITQSLAGRVGMARLLPLALTEIQPPLEADAAMLKGGYPALYSTPVVASDWFASYVATYVERDVRQLLNIQDLSTFQRFLALCAGRVGQLLNLTSLAGEAGIAVNTARAWLSVLQASDILFLLPPYHRNFGKRLVKSPKLYFVDTGLACWLLGIHDTALMALHPMRGSLFENSVIAEFIKTSLNAGKPAAFYFWRDNNGLEADVMFERDVVLQAVEIKSGRTVTSDFVRAGQRCAKIAGAEAKMPWLIHAGTDSYVRSGVRFIGWPEWVANAPTIVAEHV